MAELKQKTVTITARKDLIKKEGKQPYFTGEYDTGEKWASWKVNLFDSLAVGATVEVKYRDGQYGPIIEDIVPPIPEGKAEEALPKKLSLPQKPVPVPQTLKSRNRSIEKQVALKAAAELAVAGKIVVDKVLIFAELYDRWLNGQLTFGDGWDAKIAEYALQISKPDKKAEP